MSVESEAASNPEVLMSMPGFIRSFVVDRYTDFHHCIAFLCPRTSVVPAGQV